MSLAAKHLDPIIGIDVHTVAVPGVPAPVPLPSPYVGIVMDPLEYLPVIGATVYINGLPRAQAGTAGIQLTPHPPVPGVITPFATGESEVFMGSATVAIDGDAASSLGQPVLSCQTLGIPAPFRPKGSPPRSLVLPTSQLLALPSGPPVLIGGPPTISLQALGSQAAFAGLGKLGNMIRKAQRGPGRLGRLMHALTRRANAAGEALARKLELGATARNRIQRAVCTVTGHPVDVATGKVFTDQIDLALPGPIPFELERVWYSTSTYRGPLGHGWHHSYDAALYVEDDVILHRARDGRLIAFPVLEQGQQHFLPHEGLTLRRERGSYTLRNQRRELLRFQTVGRENAEHALVSIEDPVGHAIHLHYDAQGHMTQLQDSAGRILRFVHDATGRILELRAPHPDRADEHVRMVQYRYDNRGNLSEVIDALGQGARFEYRRHLLCHETDRNGLSFHFEYDGEDETARCVRTWGDGSLYDRRLKYDDARGITTVTNSLGFKTQYEHRDGLVLRTIDAHGGITTHDYDPHDNLIQETDPLGHVKQRAFDARGNVLSSTAPSGARLQMTYDGRDLLTETLDALGNRWSFSYDEHGRLLERKGPLDHTVRWRYAGKHLAAIVDPSGHSTSVDFDAAGNLTQLTLPDGTYYRFEYDRLGRLRTRIDPAGNSQRQHHDLLGRITRIEEPDGNIRDLRHDAEGNVTHAHDAQHDVHFTYRGMGRLASRSEAGTTVRFEYDTEEQLTSLANEHGHIYRFELGPTGELRVESGFDGIRRAYERDLAGRITEVQRPNALTTRYSYDADGRVVRVAHSDGSEEKYVYRLDGELIQSENRSCKLTFLRDPLGRILKEFQDGQWVQSDYDPSGSRVRIRSSMGADQHIERNALGLVTAVSHQSRGHSQPFETQIVRDILGLEIERSLPGGARSRWRRDRLGRPVHQSLQAAGKLERERHYRWDLGDRLKQISDSQYGTTRYTHDAVGNLAAAHHEGIAPGLELRMPDAVGNLFRREDRSDRTYGPAGQLLTSRDDQGHLIHYHYDPEGNLTRKNHDNGETWQYQWSADGTLQTVTRPDSSQVTFAYDPLGRRVSKTYRGLTTHWIWDGDVPLHEWVEGELQPFEAPSSQPTWAQNPQVQQREADLARYLTRLPIESGSRREPITWVFEPESFSPMGKLVGESRIAIVTDHLGTPIAMLDESGQQIWSGQTVSWGGLRCGAGNRQYCPFRWPGQYEDLETGLHYNRFRFYDPQSGQYTSRDPIGLAGGRALYGYVPDPLESIDPLGLSKCPGKVRGQIATLREGNDVHVATMAEARAILDNMPDVTPHTFDRRMPVHDSEAGHSNQFWQQPRGTYRGDLINKKNPVGDVHPELPQGHPHRDKPHYNVRFRDGTKAAIIIG